MSSLGAANRVEISVSVCPRPPWVGRYRSYCRRLLAALDRTSTEVSVLLTSDTRVRELNRRYRGLDRTTDVLSFQQPTATGAPHGGGYDPPGGNGAGRSLLGDIAISLEAATRNARRYRVGLEEEVRRLTTHGLLHLVGFDHQTRSERARMTALEESLLARAGRGRV